MTRPEQRGHGTCAVLAGMLAMALVGLAVLGLAYVRVYRETLHLATVLVESAEPSPGAELWQPGMRRVVLFGDSRVAHWRETPDIPGYQFVNRGRGGDTSARLLLRLDRDVLALSPHLVVIQAGINDLVAAAAWPDEAATILRDCRANLHRLVDRLAAAGVRVLYLTVVRPADPPLLRRPVWDDRITGWVDDLNAAISVHVEARGGTVVDSSALLLDPSGNWKPGVNADTLHLTEAGYRLLNGALTDHLPHAT